MTHRLGVVSVGVVLAPLFGLEVFENRVRRGGDLTTTEKCEDGDETLKAIVSTRQAAS